MRAWAVMVVAAVGCNVPDRHYSNGDARGSGGDGGGDAIRDGQIDGPPVVQPLLKAYQIDYLNGIYRATRDPTTGKLTMVAAAPVASGGSIAAITNKQGTHLYTLDVTPNAYALRDYTINLDGSLTAGAVTPMSNCNVYWAALHPSGNFLAVGCNSSYLAIVPINSNGTLGTPSITSVTGSPRVPAFTPNGNCLFFANANGGSTFENVQVFTFDSSTGAIMQQTDQLGVPACANAIAVHSSGAYAYAAGNCTPPTVQAFRIGANCLLTTYNSGLAISNNASAAMIDPQSNNLYVAGSDVSWFTIAADGSLSPQPGNPFLVGAASIQGTIMDPTLPNILYLTGQSFPGTEVASVGMTAITQLQSFSNDSNIHWLQLAP
jgi:6-phosphogluconolactonase (cycloisomerase 2 family)